MFTRLKDKGKYQNEIHCHGTLKFQSLKQKHIKATAFDTNQNT